MNTGKETLKNQRSWCFTLNGSEQVLTTFSDKLRGGINGVRYCIWQLEKGETGSNLHIQGYVELASGQRISWLRRRITERAHWEPRRGTREQARDYCRKEETRVDGPWELGEFTLGGQGRRRDLADVVERIGGGGTVSDIAAEFPLEFIKYHRGIERLIMVSGKPREPEVPHRAILLFGPPGCGKTHRVSAKYPGAYWKPTRTNWFDGYVNQDVIVYDDFNRGWFSLDEFCRIVDRYPVHVQQKGGHCHLGNRVSVFTTNTLPRYWYNFDKYGMERLAAVTRRFTKFCCFFGQGKSITLATYEEVEQFVQSKGQSHGHPYEFA